MSGETLFENVRDAIGELYGCGDIRFGHDADRARAEARAALDAIESHGAALADENERLREALTAIRDHGAEQFSCHAVFKGDCEDVMREVARAALGDGGER